MNRLTKLDTAFEAADDLPVTHEVCGDCDGIGTWLATRRVSGEYFDADQQEVVCETCNGLGATECDPRCPYCDRELTENNCDSCEVTFVEAYPLGDGRWGVGS